MPALSDVDRATSVRRAITFAVVALGIFALALEGGAYDIVVRQEFAVGLWWVIALAVLLGLLPRTAPAVSGLVVVAALLALCVWTALSLGWTSSDERTLTEVARVAAHLGVVLLVATALGPQTWRPAIAGATAAAAGVCAVALLSRLAPGAFGADDVAAAFGTSRLSQPLAYWNAVGAWAGMTVALCLGFSAHAQTVVARALAGAGIPLAITVSYLTYSRASLGGTALGLILVVALSRNRWTVVAQVVAGVVAGVVCILVVRGAPQIADGKGTAGAWGVGLVVLAACAGSGAAAAGWSLLRLDSVRMSVPRARAVFATGLAGAAVALVVAAVAVGPSAWRQFKTTDNTQSSDPAARLSSLNGSRYLIWRSALDSFEKHPWNGTGAGTFEFTWNTTGTTGEFVKDGHSLYIEPLSELGLPGLLCILALLGGAIAAVVQALSRCRGVTERGAIAAAAGAIGAFFLGAAADWLWESTAVAVLALALLGGLMAAAGRPTRALRWWWRAPAVMAAVVLCLVQLPGLVSTSEVRESQTAVAAGDLPSARAHANQAIDAQPWASTPFVQRALVNETAGDFDAAAADLREGISREREDWRSYLLLARVDAERGDVGGAVRAYKRARELRPRSKFFAATG